MSTARTPRALISVQNCCVQTITISESDDLSLCLSNAFDHIFWSTPDICSWCWCTFTMSARTFWLLEWLATNWRVFLDTDSTMCIPVGVSGWNAFAIIRFMREEIRNLSPPSSKYSTFIAVFPFCRFIRILVTAESLHSWGKRPLFRSFYRIVALNGAIGSEHRLVEVNLWMHCYHNGDLED